ncbi:cation transport ATPase [Pedobacter cryoconitis]|uniref:Cation transport ATPase n=2 Tax=Pedobacter cryoconitis TaxID=188932 RepID=A0A7X0J1L4_9SPHI|nr:cation transport ATPase [Pedobacter cryoconitis]
MLTKSEHPIATGILKKASDLKISTPPVKDFKAITGQGVEAIVEDKSVLVVGPDYLKEESINVPEGFKSNDTETVVFVIIDHKLAGYIALSDKIRPESVGIIMVNSNPNNNFSFLRASYPIQQHFSMKFLFSSFVHQ